MFRIYSIPFFIIALGTAKWQEDEFFFIILPLLFGMLLNNFLILSERTQQFFENFLGTTILFTAVCFFNPFINFTGLFFNTTFRNVSLYDPFFHQPNQINYFFEGLVMLGLGFIYQLLSTYFLQLIMFAFSDQIPYRKLLSLNLQTQIGYIGFILFNNFGGIGNSSSYNLINLKLLPLALFAATFSWIVFFLNLKKTPNYFKKERIEILPNKI